MQARHGISIIDGSAGRSRQVAVPANRRSERCAAKATAYLFLAREMFAASA